jgi:2-hydroxy-6-oxonona-2,4-dienedioate hydrolase
MQRRAFAKLAIAATFGAGLGAAATTRSFRADVAAARRRIQSGSRVVNTRLGPIEIGTSKGQRPLLMIHGTGGGFDQGLHFARRLTAAGWRVIAPSRFGYLRSPFPQDASSEAQADLFAALLDELGIERLPVLGGSAGALSAIQFALRHPQRCTALVPIVPASYVPDRLQTPASIPWASQAMEALLRSDFLFWSGLTLTPKLLTTALLATDAEVVAEANATEQQRVREILWNIMPVSERAAGLLNDARLASRPVPVAMERIAVPTLAISAEDDRFGTAAAARHIAAVVPGAQLKLYGTGGHIWVGHDADLFATVDDFLRAIAGAPA